MGMPRDYFELCQLRRGHEVIYKGVRTRVVLVVTTRGGGVGMGEYPGSTTIACQNGLVIYHDEWSTKKLTIVDKPFSDGDGGF